MQVLISWIGHTDLHAMAAEQPSSINQKISEVVGVIPPLKVGVGPVRTLVEAVSFDRIYLRRWWLVLKCCCVMPRKFSLSILTSNQESSVSSDPCRRSCRS